MKLSVILVGDNYKESAASFPISKASIILITVFIFRVFFYYLFFYFCQPVSVIFFSLCYLLRYRRNLKKCVQRRVTIPQGQLRVSSTQQS